MSSGTSSTSDYPIFSKSKDFAQGTFNKAGDVVKGSAKFTGDTLRKGADFTGKTFGKGTDFAGNLVKGTADIGKGAITGTSNIVGKTLGRTKEVGSNVFKGDVKGTVGATKDLATGSVTDVLSEFEKGLDHTFKNNYVSTTIKVIIALYAAFAAPTLSKSTAMIFDNLIVKIIISVLIIYLATKDASMAIILALAFILTLQTANKYKLIDTSQSVNKNSGLSWLPSASSSKKSDNSKESFTNRVHNDNLNRDDILEKQQLDYAPVLSSHDATGIDTITSKPHNKNHKHHHKHHHKTRQEVYPEEARQEVYPEEARQEVYPEEARQEVYPEEARQEVYPEKARQEVYTDSRCPTCPPCHSKPTLKPESEEEGIYPQAYREESFPESQSESYQEVYPEARQEVYPETRQEVYPDTRQEVYPEARQEVYPEARQEVYPETRQEVYPEARQEVYPEARQEVYPEATQPPPHYHKKTRNANHCKPKMYKYDGSNSKNNSQFSNIATNVVPGANQNSCPQSWKSQHCIQGLNKPRGFDETIYPYNNN